MLKGLDEDASEILKYVPTHFKVIRIVRPKHACTRCDVIVQEPARRIARLTAGWQVRGCWHTFWSASIAITFRSTGNRKSTNAKASNWSVRHWRVGSAAPAR